MFRTLNKHWKTGSKPNIRTRFLAAYLVWLNWWSKEVKLFKYKAIQKTHVIIACVYARSLSLVNFKFVHEYVGITSIITDGVLFVIEIIKIQTKLELSKYHIMGFLFLFGFTSYSKKFLTDPISIPKYLQLADFPKMTILYVRSLSYEALILRYCESAIKSVL